MAENKFALRIGRYRCSFLNSSRSFIPRACHRGESRHLEICRSPQCHGWMKRSFASRERVSSQRKPLTWARRCVKHEWSRSHVNVHHDFAERPTFTAGSYRNGKSLRQIRARSIVRCLETGRAALRSAWGNEQRRETIVQATNSNRARNKTRSCLVARYTAVLCASIWIHGASITALRHVSQ